MKEIFRLEVKHDYFERGLYGINIQPSNECRILLIRRRMIFVQISSTTWALMAESSTSLNESDILELEFQVTDSFIPYVTDIDWNWGKEGYELEISESNTSIQMKFQSYKKIDKMSSSFLRLKVLIGHMLKDTDKCSIKLHFDAPSFYWQYVLIPRHDDWNRTLKIEESQQRIIFKESVESVFFDRKVFTCISTNKIRSQERADYSLCLCEITSQDSKRRIMNHLPLPDVGKNHLITLDTVQQILYF